MVPLTTELYKILVGPLFGCIALACYCSCLPEVEAITSLGEDRFHATIHILLDYTYISLSMLLVLATLAIQALGQYKDTFNAGFTLLSLTTPALPAMFHINRVLDSNWDYGCSEAFMVSLSAQLVVSALSVLCFCGKNVSEKQQKILDIATNAFSIVAMGILAFSLKPALISTGYKLGLCGEWEPDSKLSSRLLIFLGYIMQSFLMLRYHTHSRLLPLHTSMGYISATILFGISLLSRSPVFNMTLLIVGILLPLVGLAWDVATMQQKLVDDLNTAQQDSIRWQAMANTLTDASTITESAVSTKIAFIISLRTLRNRALLSLANYRLC